MSDDERMEDLNSEDENDENVVLDESSILRVIPLEEFLESNGRAAFAGEDDNDEAGGDEEDDVDFSREDDFFGSTQFHEKDIFCIATCGDRFIATGSEDDRAALYDLEQSVVAPVVVIPHKDSVIFARFNKNMTLLATGDMSGRIVVTTLATLATFQIEDCSDLEWMQWHTASDILFAGDADGIMWMWLIANGEVVQSKVYSAGGGARSTSGRVLQDGRRLLAAYADGHLRLWSLKDQTHVGLQLPSEVSALEVSDKGELAAAGTIQGDLHLLSTQDSQLRVLNVYPWIPDSTTLVAKENEEAMEEETAEHSVECISFGPFLVIGRNDGTTAIYATDSAAPRFVHRTPTAQAITSLAWCNLGGQPSLVTSSIDGFIRFFDPRDGRLIVDLSAGAHGIMDMSVVEKEALAVRAACGPVLGHFQFDPEGRLITRRDSAE